MIKKTHKKKARKPGLTCFFIFVLFITLQTTYYLL